MAEQALILASATDELAILAYADYLEESGQQEAADYLRDMSGETRYSHFHVDRIHNDYVEDNGCGCGDLYGYTGGEGTGCGSHDNFGAQSGHSIGHSLCRSEIDD